PDGEWSRREQAGVHDADAATRHRLAAANRAYEDRFGHVYLVCATGKSAEELLAILAGRLRNDPLSERGTVRAELGKINRIRLQKLLGDARTEGEP
ncbi:MAG: 2-oxo-4-hydroxy-4-carboxy-5-ureidoimidazoline decarboxylase, partial [Jiangellaceae bacterium]